MLSRPLALKAANFWAILVFSRLHNIILSIRGLSLYLDKCIYYINFNFTGLCPSFITVYLREKMCCWFFLIFRLPVYLKLKSWQFVIAQELYMTKPGLSSRGETFPPKPQKCQKYCARWPRYTDFSLVYWKSLRLGGYKLLSQKSTLTSQSWGLSSSVPD